MSVQLGTWTVGGVGFASLVADLEVYMAACTAWYPNYRCISFGLLGTW